MSKHERVARSAVGSLATEFAAYRREILSDCEFLLPWVRMGWRFVELAALLGIPPEERSPLATACATVTNHLDGNLNRLDEAVVLYEERRFSEMATDAFFTENRKLIPAATQFLERIDDFGRRVVAVCVSSAFGDPRGRLVDKLLYGAIGLRHGRGRTPEDDRHALWLTFNPDIPDRATGAEAWWDGPEARQLGLGRALRKLPGVVGLAAKHLAHYRTVADSERFERDPKGKTRGRRLTPLAGDDVFDRLTPTGPPHDDRVNDSLIIAHIAEESDAIRRYIEALAVSGTPAEAVRDIGSEAGYRHLRRIRDRVKAQLAAEGVNFPIPQA